MTSAAEAWSVSLALVADAVGQVAVVVPALMVELDESHAALGQPAGQQAVGGERAGRAAVGAVQLEDGVRLLREIGDVGHARLHAERHLVLGDRAIRFRGRALSRTGWRLSAFELVEHRAAAGAADAVGVAEIEHRVLAGAKLDALVLRVEEAAAPQAGVERLVALASP